MSTDLKRGCKNLVYLNFMRVNNINYHFNWLYYIVALTNRIYRWDGKICLIHYTLLETQISLKLRLISQEFSDCGLQNGKYTKYLPHQNCVNRA